MISERHRPRQALQGEKVSLKIHRADLVDSKTVFQIGSFFMT